MFLFNIHLDRYFSTLKKYTHRLNFYVKLTLLVMNKFLSTITVVNKYIIVKQINLVTNVTVAIPTFKKLPDNWKINFLKYLPTNIFNLKIYVVSENYRDKKV